MGWMLKGLVLVAGLLSLSVGFWPLWVPCFAYLGYSLWRATRKTTVVLKDERDGRRSRSPRRVSFRKRYVASVFFVLLALVSFDLHGTFAPWFFVTIATLTALSGTVGRVAGTRSMKQVPDSILLRSPWLPFSWTCLAEVKLATPKISGALSSAGSELIMSVSGGTASVYAPLRVRSLSASSAERKAAVKLAELAKRLGPRGAYVLPLDSKDACSRMTWSLAAVETGVGDRQGGPSSLSSVPFDVLVLAPDGHMLESASAYILDSSKPGKVSIPEAGGKLESQPLMWEVLEKFGATHLPQTADAYTNFLSSVCATRGEGLGDRLLDGGETGAGTILVGSIGATQVELSRPQLRAIVREYE